MSDYQGIKIYKRLIIVKNKKGQGYIVEEGNKGSLETAERWASWGEYAGASFTYDNGNFDFELLDAAGGSNQGGKLSFWNCKITAPDNEEFIVGINSEILLELLKYNKFENGKLLNKKIYFGRIRGNAVGAFTDNMPLFEQAKKDEETRIKNNKKTVKYDPGTVVSSLSEGKRIYYGVAYQYARYDNFTCSDQGYINTNRWASIWQDPKFADTFGACIVINEKPMPNHIYGELESNIALDEVNVDNKSRYVCVDKNTTKYSRAVEGKVELKTTPADVACLNTKIKLLRPDSYDVQHYGYDKVAEELKFLRDVVYGNDTDRIVNKKQIYDIFSKHIQGSDENGENYYKISFEKNQWRLILTEEEFQKIKEWYRRRYQ